MDYIAKKAFQSKVSGFTNDAKGALGMDGKKDDKKATGQNKAAIEAEKRRVADSKAKMEVKQAKRRAEREGKREAIRDKYSKDPKQKGGGEEEKKEEKECCIQ
eukprot:m.57853 g.57853  ORF g.57853 m.57853 type:complete len:103 (-) comp22454_c0_seq1:141-449(-)